MKSVYFFNPFVLFKYILIISLILSVKQAACQDIQIKNFTIKGQLIDQSSKASLAYAHIYNLRTKVGSVTDEDGYFGFEGNALGDTLSVSFIGYISRIMVIDSKQELKIELQENIQQLEELTLEYDNSDYLYQLIQACIKNKSKVKAEGKAYYELHSFKAGKQVELVESFYNASIKGYDLESLKMKAGRLGIQTGENGGTLVSLESSKAILKLNLIEDADNFYENPFQLSYRQLKKWYDLNVFKAYTSNSEEMLVVRFSPKTEDLNLFDGLVWINKTTKQIHKISLECEDCRIHPFLVNSNHERHIDQLNLKIIKTFEPQKGNMILNHVDFTYSMQYLSRMIKMKTTTKVLVDIYNFKERFNLPKYNRFDEPRHDQDYREIAEAPYNTFFWDKHNEFSVFDKGEENKDFLNHPNTIQGEEYLHKLTLGERGESEFFEHPSFTWSKKRLRFAEVRKDDTTHMGQPIETPKYYGPYNGQFKSDMYQFYGKIYLDRNEYQGQVDIVLESIFDSSRSFYKLPIDWKVQVFVNMYFDLVEIEKRKLEQLITASDQSIQTINLLYEQSEIRLSATHKLYIKEMRRGDDRAAMEKWSALIYSKLKINNIEVFQHEEE